ncbi:MAG: HAMP domain-containing sensor histidine kinase [bacterium]
MTDDTNSERARIWRFFRPASVILTVALAADLAAIAMWPSAQKVLVIFAAAFTALLCLFLWRALSIAESATDICARLLEQERAARAAVEVRNRQLENTIGKLEEVERIKKNFLLMASHQMRSPLVAIQSVIRVIVSGAIGGDDESVKHLLQQAYDRSEDMLGMVNDILDLAEAKVEKDEGTEQTDAAAELNAVVSLLRPTAAERGITIETDVAAGLPMARVARKSVNHIFTNLVDNAIKYSKDNTVVRVKLVAEGDRMRIDVADQGIGIPQEAQQKIFKEFFRADNAKMLIKQGTGLGLAIVQNIVQNLGGDISFVSKENEGTTFTARVPFTPSPQTGA